MHRRTLLRWLLSGAAAWPLRGIELHAQAAALSRTAVATLRALAPAVLPSELGAAGHDKVVSDFVQWLASYRSGADRNWGYGHPRRSVSPTIEIASYDAQLAALDNAAKAGAGELSTLPLDVRRTIVAARLDAIGVRTLPGAPNGAHVMTDFLAFYYGSTAATDLVYRSRIGRGTCRGLAGAGSRPASVAGD
jgi:hypothetical protein